MNRLTKTLAVCMIIAVFAPPVRGQLPESIPRQVRDEMTLDENRLLIDNADDAAMAYLAHFPELESLEIWPTKLTGKGFRHVAGLKKLKSLRINAHGFDTDIDDADLACLTGLKHLTTLDIGEFSGLTPAGVTHLAGLEQLESLTLREKMLNDESLELLKQLPCLRALKIAMDAEEPENLLEKLCEFKGLKSLTLECWNIASQCKHLARMPQLEELSLPYVIWDSEDQLSFLGHLPELRVLNLERAHTGVTDKTLAYLFHCPKLQVLNISDSLVSDDGMAYVAELSDLRTLVLPHDITDEGLFRLNRLAKLETLELDQNEITDAGLARLDGLKNLKNLTMRHCPITDAGLRALANFPLLETLVIWYSDENLITDAGIAHLRALQHLESLDLYDVNITPQGLAELRDLPRLTLLCVSLFGETDLSPLGELKQLHILDIDCDDSVTDADFAFLPQLAGLRSLTLTYTHNLTDAFLQHLETLEHLETVFIFANMKFSDAALEAFRKKRPNCRIHIDHPPWGTS